MALRRSFTSKTAPPRSVTEISSTLAMKILETENQVLKSPSPLSIQDLISLYSEAIEFYSSKNDSKYLDFQKRMHSLLSNPQILKSLSNPSQNSPQSLSKTKKISQTFVTPSPKTEEKSAGREPVQDLIEEERSGSENGSPVSTCPSLPSPVNKDLPQRRSVQLPKFEIQGLEKTQGRNCKIIVDRHQKFTKETVHRAIKDFKSQDSALQGRLASRKKQMLTRSMTSRSFSFMNSSDVVDEPVQVESNKGCFVIEEHPVEMDKFELKLEAIMENNFSQRAAKIAEVRLKYEGQITEMSGMGDLMQMVVVQMKESMQKEICAVVEEFDKIRKEQIRELKEKKCV